MGFIKLTDKEIGSKPAAATKFVVTQPENIDGVQKESVRRVGLTEIVNLVLSAGVAAEFSTSTAYSSGDYVVYQGELYRFKAAHAAGDWNTAHVNKVVLMDEIQSALGTDKTLTEENVPADAKKVGGELSDLKDALSDLEDAVEHIDVETDTTLSVEGKPADAKAVGDELLNTRLNSTLSSDVAYDDNDVINYSSGTNVMYNNQYCVVISPSETTNYYIKSAKVKSNKKETVKFSIFTVSWFYNDTDSMQRRKFTKKYDIATAEFNDDGYAEIVFDKPLLIDHVHGEVLVATTEINCLAIGSYKAENIYNINNYSNNWFNLKNGEYSSIPYPRDTNTSHTFELNYIKASDVSLEEMGIKDYLQKQINYPQYDSKIDETSENAVRNSTIYKETNIVKTTTIGTDELMTYSNTSRFRPDFTNRYVIRIFVPEVDDVTINSIDCYCTSGKSVRFGLWSFRRIDSNPSSGNYNRGYVTLTRILGEVNEVNNHATLDFGNTPLDINPNTDIILATTETQALGVGSSVQNVSTADYNEYGQSAASFYNTNVGTENSNLIWLTPIYDKDKVKQSSPSVFTVDYHLKEAKTITEVINVKNAVDLLISKSTNNASGWLSNLKWACCGDSVTAGIQNADGYNRNYAYYIAKRNGILGTDHLYLDGIGGSTMTMCTGKENVSFANLRYKDIPVDTNIITIWFGINDTTEDGLGHINGVGTIDSTDITTFYGAYNTVLTYFINNIPNAKIGLVVTHRCGPDYRTAIRALAQKYGLKTFDIWQDPNIPYWHYMDSVNASGVDETIQQKRIAQWWRESTNCVHPTEAGYEYISYPFEAWMKTL